jgi:hypothetical protein
MTTQNGVNTSLSGQTGTGSFVGSNTPLITTPSIASLINDTNGNALIGFSAIASAVNYVQLQGNTTGNPPAMSAVGSDTNVTFQLNGKGTGGVTVQGTGTNNNAASGYIGEFISSVITSGSPTTMSSNAATNVTSISLTAGDWDVWGNVSFVTLGTTPTGINGWVSSTSATVPDQSLRNGMNFLAAAGLTNGSGITAPILRFSLASTTTIYLSGFLSNTSGTGTACGGIYARRSR